MLCPWNNTNLVRDKPPAVSARTRDPDWSNRIMCHRSSDDQLLEPIFLLSLSAHRSEVTRYLRLDGYARRLRTRHVALGFLKRIAYRKFVVLCGAF